MVITLRLAAAAGLATGRGPIRYGVVYAISLLSIAGQCLLQYLAADQAYFHDLVLIDLLYVAAVHTPRRTAAAVALAVAGFLPGMWASAGAPESVSIAEWAAEAVLWALVAGLVALYTGIDPPPARRAAPDRRARGGARPRRLPHEPGQPARVRRVLRARAERRPALRDAAEHPHRRPRRLQGRQRRPRPPGRRRAASRGGASGSRRRCGGRMPASAGAATSSRSSSRGPASARPSWSRRASTRGLAGEVRDPGGTPAAISMGVAELGTDQEPHELLATADAALLAAKTRRPAPRPPALRPARCARRRAAVASRAVARLVALLRGINVGRNKRIGMADLRALLEELGYEDVRTLLQSGNAVFECAGQARCGGARDRGRDRRAVRHGGGRGDAHGGGAGRRRRGRSARRTSPRAAPSST